MNRIGIENQSAKSLSQKLGELLANYQVFYTNVRAFHWNVKGVMFFQLHESFEKTYNGLNAKIDEIAERILTLGSNPEYRYSEYLKTAKIKEVTESEDGMKGMENIYESFQLIIKMQREILSLAADSKDEGTVALMSDYISEQEKLIWMYSAFLNK